MNLSSINFLLLHSSFCNSQLAIKMQVARSAQGHEHHSCSSTPTLPFQNTCAQLYTSGAIASPSLGSAQTSISSQRHRHRGVAALSPSLSILRSLHWERSEGPPTPGPSRLSRVVRRTEWSRQRRCRAAPMEVLPFLLHYASKPHLPMKAPKRTRMYLSGERRNAGHQPSGV